MIKALCLIISMYTPAPECGRHLEYSKKNTHISQDELVEVLEESYYDTFKSKPNHNTINMAWAQIAFENGRGEKVYNFNLGNIGANPLRPIRPYYKIAGSRFRSFPSFKDGARCYWTTLKERCSGALKHFAAGDPYSASLALQRCGYYRAEFDHYYLNLKSLYYEGQSKNFNY